MGGHYCIRLYSAGINKPITNPTHRGKPDLMNYYYSTLTSRDSGALAQAKRGSDHAK